MADDPTRTPFEIEPRAGFVSVRQTRALADLAEGQRALELVERALTEHEVRRAVFDQRGTGEHAADVREQMWAWVRAPGRLDAVALVVDSELAGVEANMTAISRHVKLRAFTDRVEAEAWVRTTVPGTRTGFFPRIG